MLIIGHHQNTKALVEQARNGNRDAFDTLVARHCGRLESLLRIRIGTPLLGRVTVDDILQDTLLQAFRSLERFQWESNDAFFRWLTGIAENVIRNEARRRHEGTTVRLDPKALKQVSPSKEMRRNERFDRLRSSINALSENHRQVIMLSRVEGLRIKEVAKIMGRSEGAVKSLLLRALRELQKSFGNTESLELPARSLTEESDD